MKRIPKCLALMLLCARVSSAQEAPDTLVLAPDDPENFLVADASEEAALAELDRLNAMLDHPIDLNSASESEFLLLPGFDRGLARLVLDSVSHGPRAVAELENMTGMSRADLAAAVPFIMAGGERERAELPSFSGSVQARAEAVVSQRPAEEGRVSGSRWKVLHRIMLERRGDPVALKAALVIEKDAGEPRFADHAAGFLWIRPAEGLELSAGDFALESAMGLAFGGWGGAVRGPGPSGAGAWKSLVARPRASSSESGGLRGLLAACRSGRLEAALFYSNRALHAHLDDASVLTSFYQAGLFRTASEEALRFRTRERAVGARLSVRIAESLQLGASASQSAFLHPVGVPSLGGRRTRCFSLAAVDALVSVRRVELGAEYATDKWGKGAVAVAMHARLSGGLGALASVRWAQKGFVSLHGLPASESGEHSSITMGLRWKVLNGLRLEISSDQRRSISAGPGGLALTARDVAVRLEADPPGPLVLVLQARARFSGEIVDGLDAYGRGIRGVGERRVQSARLCLKYGPSAALRLTCACEVRGVRGGEVAKTDHAVLVTHDLRWKAAPWLGLEIRASSYATDSYAARLFLVEQTVRTAMSQTVLYGSGLRWSAHLQLSLGRAAAEVTYSETDRTLEKDFGGRPMLEVFERCTISAQLELRY